MNDWLTAWLNQPQAYTYLAIPVVAALVGWLTNWLALAMTFKPIEFIGFRSLRLGWQGIVPAKSGKMAGIVVDNALAKLADLSELFQAMEPDKIAEHIVSNIDGRIEDYIDEVMRENHALLWERVPLMVRRRVYARTRRQLPEVMDNIVEDMAANIEQLVDLRDMVVRMMRANKALVVRVFTEVGAKELSFVVRSGAYFGFLFGLIELAIFMMYPEPWLLPLFGFVVGYLTNWLALNLIFRPVEPMHWGPLHVHGLFMRRKEEVADKLSALTTAEIINLRNLMVEVLTGPQADKTRAIVKRHLRPLLDSSVIRAALQLAMGAEAFVDLKNTVTDRAVSMSLDSITKADFSEERSKIIHQVFSARLKTMSNSAFQDLLRPAFKEDEWTLIGLGAVLGGMAGMLQWLLMIGL
jgi:uncharacterized membrane protein YheB (UPF0754 family)